MNTNRLSSTQDAKQECMQTDCVFCSAELKCAACRDQSVIASFSVAGVPIAQPRHKIRIVKGKTPYAIHYIDSNHPIRGWKKELQQAARDAMQDRAPSTVAMSAALMFILPRPITKVWKRKPMPRYDHTSKPDLDNLCKAVFDALSGIVFCDDRQIAKIICAKQVAAGNEQPRVEVELIRLPVADES